MAAPTSLRDTRVKRFSPTGASDSLDATDEFPGACASLANLIPDLTTRNLWTPRPGATLITDFSSGWQFTIAVGPGGAVPTALKIVGDVAYGMCAATGGVDKPFAYNLATSTFVTITITGGSVFPTSQTFGVNFPVPTMDLIGHFIMITHPGYPLSAAGCVGVIDISTPSVPVYNSGNSAGAISFVTLGAVPSFVRQFNQRAYYGVNVAQPSLVASDPLTPLTITNAGQVLTFGDNLPLTGAAPMGLSNQLGGIIQSLMVFKGETNTYQVTGDYAGSTWAINTLNTATGAGYPRGVTSTPLGLAFIDHDGLRIIDQNGTVSDPIGIAGKGINAAIVNLLSKTFSNNVTCSLGCDGSIIRVSMYDTAGFGLHVEYWYHLTRKVWSGPHTFSALQFDLWRGGFVAIISEYMNLPGGLYTSPTDTSQGNSYSEFGSPLSFTMQSAMLEDSGQMAQSSLAEMQIVLGSDASKTYTITLIDSNGSTINSSSITSNPGGSKPGLYPYRIDFPSNSVFNRAAISISGTSASLKIGDSWLRITTTGYITNNP